MGWVPLLLLMYQVCSSLRDDVLFAASVMYFRSQRVDVLEWNLISSSTSAVMAFVIKVTYGCRARAL